MYRNASAVDETFFRAKSQYGRLDSTNDGEVFKSKFVREYYTNLLEDINRTLSVAQDPKSSFQLSPGLRPDLLKIPSFGDERNVTMTIEGIDREPLMASSRSGKIPKSQSSKNLVQSADSLSSGRN